MLFSVNLSVLFSDFLLLERIKLARDNGFNYVEIPDPYGYHPREIAREMHGTKCTLINTYEGKNFGYAAVPGEEYEFCRSLNRTIKYYNELGFQKIHIRTGTKRPEHSFEAQFDKLVSSLDSATDFFEEYRMTGLIEPVCKEENEDYFLSSFDTAVDVLEATSNKNIKLLINTYHLHQITGDVKKNLEKYYPYAGHIRIANAKSMNDGCCDGDIDYNHVFEFLNEKKHEDIVGLEYFPVTSSKDPQDWLKEYI